MVCQETLTKTLFTAKKPSITQGLHLKRKTLVATFISVLLFSVIAEAVFGNLAIANPIGALFPHDPKPKITVLLPRNNTVYNRASFYLMFTMDLAEWYNYDSTMNKEILPLSSLGPIVYYVDEVFAGQIQGQVSKKPYNLRVALNKLNDGLHSVEVTASTSGEYWSAIYMSDGPHHHRINGVTRGSSGLIYFSVDTIVPTISILSLENTTYHEKDVQLSCQVDEDVAEIAYRLDGQQKMATTAKTILTDLREGEHYITMYATDAAGNTGVSETIYFSVDTTEPFPKALVVAASGMSVAVIVACLLLSFKKKARTP